MVSASLTFVSLLCLTAWRVASVESTYYTYNPSGYSYTYTPTPSSTPAPAPVACTSSLPANKSPYSISTATYSFNGVDTKMCLTIKVNKKLALSSACQKALAKSLQSITIPTVVTEIKQVKVANKNCAYSVQEVVQTETVTTPYVVTIATKLTKKNANKAKVCLTIAGEHTNAISISGASTIKYSLNSDVSTSCCVAANVPKPAPAPVVYVPSAPAPVPVVYVPSAPAPVVCSCSGSPSDSCKKFTGACDAYGRCFVTPKCSGSTPFCLGGNCYQCLTDSNCPGIQTCNQHTYTCVAPNPTCSCTGSPADACKKFTGSCDSYGNCLTAPKCSGATPYCSGTACVQCLVNTNCPSDSTCVNGSCIKNQVPTCSCTGSPADACKKYTGSCDTYSGACLTVPKCSGVCFNGICDPYIGK